VTDIHVNLHRAAEAAGVSRRNLYYWMRAGLLAFERRGTSRLVLVADVVRCRDRRQQVDKRHKYRADGWPLCPSCGDDELTSLELQPKPTDDLTCLLCGWKGTVPERAVWLGPDRRQGDRRRWPRE